MKKWVCRLSIVCCLCLFFTSVKAQLSLGGLGDILNSSTVNKVVSAIAGTDASLTVADLAGRGNIRLLLVSSKAAIS